MDKQSNAERFVIAFAAIEKVLNSISRRPRYIPFRTNARIAARYNPVVRNYLEDICMFAELRNCIVHNRDGELEVVAEPSDATTEKIERIAELLQRDHKLLSFATSPVITADSEGNLRDAIACMNEHQIEKMPVYHEGKFQGMFTLRQILHYLLENTEDKHNVEDVLDSMAKDRVVFVDSTTSLEHIVKIFDDFGRMDLKEPAIIVTEHGELDEEPLGILTMHDLARIITFLA